MTATFPIRNNKDSFNNTSTIIDESFKRKSHLSKNDYNKMAAVVSGMGSSLEEDSVTESGNS